MTTRTVRKAIGRLGEPNPNPGNIIICLDGTSGKPDVDDDNVDTSSNVYHISQALDLPTRGQHAIYVKGIGNRDDYTQLGSLLAGATGIGWVSQLYTAYERLVETYRIGDRIFIFGFSRGAAVARQLGLFLEEHGIAEVFRTGYRITGSPSHQQFKRRFVEFGERQVPVAIEMMGLWDTVCSFGLARNIGILKFQRWDLFQKFALAGNVKRAYHLMAIDEDRESFYPKLLDPSDRVVELWMPGVHTDIGGGVNRSITNIALRFMLKRAAECGLQVSPDFQDLPCDPLAELTPTDDHVVFGQETRKIPSGAKFYETVASRYDGVATWRPSNLPAGWRRAIVKDSETVLPDVGLSAFSKPRVAASKPRPRPRRIRRRGGKM